MSSMISASNRDSRLEDLGQFELSFCVEKLLDEKATDGIIDAAAAADELLAEGAEDVRFAAPRIAKGQDILQRPY